MLGKVESTYFSLLRRAIGFEDTGKSLYYAGDVNWNTVIRLSLQQGTAPLIFNEVLSLSVSQSFNLHEKQRVQMKQVCMQNMLAEQRLMAILKQTFVALNKGGVHPVLLKGFGLASLYPKPYLRSWGDLDVYVGPSQYHKSAAILRETFPDAVHHEEEWEELKHYQFFLRDALIEMHRITMKMDHPRDSRIYYALENEGMRCCETSSEKDDHSVDIEGLKINLPEVKFNVLYTFLHAVYHLVGENLSMKQICDMAMLAHTQFTMYNAHCSKDQMERYLRSNLRKLRLMQLWQLFGYVCIHYLKLPPGEWPCYHETHWVRQHGEQFLQAVLCYVPHGESTESRADFHKKRDQWNVIYRKWWTMLNQMKTVKKMWQYSPQYAWHMMETILLKGMRRIVRQEAIVPYTIDKLNCN